MNSNKNKELITIIIILHYENDINKGVGFEYGDAFYPNVGWMRECRSGWWL